MNTSTPPQDIPFNNEEWQRYNRHFNLPEVGIAGQTKLKASRVLVIGAGGLGSPLLSYLAAAGVGTLGIIDDDIVEVSNLQRQILYTTQEIGLKKIEAAKTRLTHLNPHIQIITYDQKLSSDNAAEIIAQYDCVADGSDNFATRYLVNDACFQFKKPHVYASISRFEGQCSVFTAEAGPCYRCLFPTPPPPESVPNCALGGVLGVLPGVIGSLQATEVIKILLKIGEPLIGRLLMFNALTMRFREVRLSRSADCSLCNHQPLTEQAFSHSEWRSGTMTTLSAADEISVKELKALRDERRAFFLLDVREPQEHAFSNLRGHLIPLGELPERIVELDPSHMIIVHCKLGGRSRQAVNYLRSMGFPHVLNLTGGIMAWKQEIEPDLPV